MSMARPSSLVDRRLASRYIFQLMATRFVSADDLETEHFGATLAKRLDSGSIVALYGPLGAGKTVLVRGMARGLGIEEAVTSPSDIIVAEYRAAIPLIHIDLYRTSSDEELELLGFDEIISQPGIVAIEWADRAGNFLPVDSIRITISICEGGREITVEGRTVEGIVD